MLIEFCFGDPSSKLRLYRTTHNLLRMFTVRANSCYGLWSDAFDLFQPALSSAGCSLSFTSDFHWPNSDMADANAPSSLCSIAHNFRICLGYIIISHVYLRSNDVVRQQSVTQQCGEPFRKPSTTERPEHQINTNHEPDCHQSGTLEHYRSPDKQ